MDLHKGESKSWLRIMSENIIEMMIPGEETLPTAMTMAVKFLSDYPLALSKLLVCMFLYLLQRVIFLFFRSWSTVDNSSD